jgi:hypothetical protein
MEGRVTRLAMSARNQRLGAFVQGGRFWLDLKGFGFGHDRKQPESEQIYLAKKRYTYRFCINQNDSTLPPNRVQDRELAFDYQRWLLQSRV